MRTRSSIRIFQSTPPVKAATNDAEFDGGKVKISIHAAREGGDAPFSKCRATSSIFQSTPPVKAATSMPIASSIFRVFQSTPPVKAATR